MGRIREYTTLYLHEFVFKSYESLQDILSDIICNYLLSWTWVYAYTHCDRLDVAILSSLKETRWGRIRAHTTLYFHVFDCRSYDSLHLSSLIPYATIVWLEPGLLIQTVIDLIWRYSAVMRSSAEAHQGTYNTVSACISLTVDFDNYLNAGFVDISEVCCEYYCSIYSFIDHLRKWVHNYPSFGSAEC